MKTFTLLSLGMIGLCLLMVIPSPDALHILWVSPVIALWAAGAAFGGISWLVLKKFFKNG